MAKKYPVKEPARNPIPAAPLTASPSLFRAANIIPLAICFLYLCVHFITDFGAYDAMGPQWLYMVILDFLVIVYLLSRKPVYEPASGVVFRNLFSKLYLAFFVLAGLSTFTAINPTEAWVCYVRLIATIIAFFNMAILLHGRVDLFKWLAQLMALILLVESLQTLSEFFSDMDKMDIKNLIMNMKGTAGNKNIFAAAMIVKIPFALYCIHTSKLGQRILNIFILLAAGFTLFLANSRASYLSLMVITALYMIYCFLEYRKEKKAEQFLYRIAYVLLPLVAAFFISQVELTTVKNLQDDTLVQKKAVEDVGTVTERLQGITNIADESNRVRLRLWMHAADYTKKHPLIGCGYGNWKIASIPYQRTITEELFVPVHAHNDFIEAFAELGIPGGLLYLAMFFCILVFTVRTYLSDADPETKYMSVFSLLAFTGYSVDAFFNFPGERPVSQMFFALITAVNISAYNQSRAAAADPANKPAGGMTLIPLYGFLSIFFLMPAAYVTYLTHKSLVVQKYLIPDMGNEPMKLKWQELFPKIPPIPNISASAQPMDAIKGRYLFEAGKYEEAIILMDKGYKANPLIGYSEFLKAGVYYRMGKMDSAQRNAIKAFYTRPKASTYLQTLMAVLAKTKDTVEIRKAFREWDRYRHSAFGWNLYLLALVNAIGKGTPELLTLADTAIHQFPKDTILPLRRAEIVQFMAGGSAGVQSAATAAADLARAQTLYNAGVAAFTKAKQGAPPANKEDYIEAARNFLKAAAITPNNYIIYENAAIAYFNMGDYPKALVYLDKVINMKTAVTGKSEYFKGVALYNQGKREEGCSWLKIARTKGYAEADGIIKSSCK